MSQFEEKSPSFADKIKGLFGFKTSQDDKYKKLRENLVQSRITNEERFESLKKDIQRLGNRAVQKNIEAEASGPDVRKLIIHEIEQIFRDIDNLQGQQNIIIGNLRRISLQISKIDEIMAAKIRGADSKTLDALLIDFQELTKDMRGNDITTSFLEKECYELPEEEETARNIHERLSDIQGVADTSGAMPESIQKRLQELTKV